MNIMFFLTPKHEVSYLYHDQTIAEGLESMQETGYTAIPLISREGRYIGTVTEGDFLRALSKPEIWNQRDIMYMEQMERRVQNRPVRAEAQIIDLLDTALHQNFVPVIDDRDCFIGIVTRQRIMNYCISEINKKTLKMQMKEKAIVTRNELNEIWG